MSFVKDAEIASFFGTYDSMSFLCFSVIIRVD